MNFNCIIMVCVGAVVQKYAVADISFVVLYVVGAEKVSKGESINILSDL